MRERDKTEFAILAELVDWDEPEVDDPDEDFPVDDGDVEVSPAYGCDGGAYFVEANSGPGWAR